MMNNGCKCGACKLASAGMAVVSFCGLGAYSVEFCDARHLCRPAAWEPVHGPHNDQRQGPTPQFWLIANSTVSSVTPQVSYWINWGSKPSS
jgi:hypothetical protein